MLHVTFITVGDLPRGAFQELRGTYLKYLLRYARIDHRAIKDDKDVLHRVDPSTTVVVLDAAGAAMTSEAFAKKIQGYDEMGTKLTIIIGGAFGLPDDVKKRADVLLSLSPMTTTHDLAHIFFLEQLYRAFTIITGKEYHK